MYRIYRYIYIRKWHWSRTGIHQYFYSIMQSNITRQKYICCQTVNNVWGESLMTDNEKNIHKTRQRTVRVWWTVTPHLGSMLRETSIETLICDCARIAFLQGDTVGDKEVTAFTKLCHKTDDLWRRRPKLGTVWGNQWHPLHINSVSFLEGCAAAFLSHVPQHNDKGQNTSMFATVQGWAKGRDIWKTQLE